MTNEPITQIAMHQASQNIEWKASIYPSLIVIQQQLNAFQKDKRGLQTAIAKEQSTVKLGK